MKLIGEEHNAKLADNDIKALIFKGQRKSISLLPLNRPVFRLARGCIIKHRLIEIGCDDACVRREP